MNWDQIWNRLFNRHLKKVEPNYPSGAGFDLSADAVWMGVDYGKEPINIVLFDRQMRVVDRITVERPEEVEESDNLPRGAPDPIPEDALPTMEEAMKLVEGEIQQGPKYRVHGQVSDIQKNYDAVVEFHDDSLSGVHLPPDLGQEGLDAVRAIAAKYGLGITLSEIEPWELLHADGWRQSSKDFLWRNNRFGGSYKTENALKRLGSIAGEITTP